MIASIASRSRSTRSGSLTPNTARQITSKVSARIRSRIANSRARPPSLDLRLGDLADHLAKAAHRRALERRQQQLALAQVLACRRGPAPSCRRARAKRRVRLAGVQVGLVAREQLADRLRVGDVDPGPEDEVADREGVAVATAPAGQRLERALDEERRVDGGGSARARGEGHATESKSRWERAG